MYKLILLTGLFAGIFQNVCAQLEFVNSEKIYFWWNEHEIFVCDSMGNLLSKEKGIEVPYTFYSTDIESGSVEGGDISWVYSDHSGLISVIIDNYWGAYNATGELVVPFVMHASHWFDSLGLSHSGRFFEEGYLEDFPTYSGSYKDVHYGYLFNQSLDTLGYYHGISSVHNGHIVLEDTFYQANLYDKNLKPVFDKNFTVFTQDAPSYEVKFDIQDNLLVVARENGNQLKDYRDNYDFGVISFEGQEVFPIEYDYAELIQVTDANPERMVSDGFSSVKDHYEILLKKDNKWGLSDYKGNLKTPFEYDSIVTARYEDNTVLLLLNEQTSTLQNRDQTLIIPGKVDLSTLNESYHPNALKDLSSNNFVINSQQGFNIFLIKEEKLLFSEYYEQIEPMVHQTSDGQEHFYYKIKKDGLWGFTNPQGKIIVEPQYRHLCNFHKTSGKAHALKGSNQYMVNITGEEKMLENRIFKNCFCELAED